MLKELGQKKIQNNDFEGAQKDALKAEGFHSRVENVSQVLNYLFVMIRW